MKISQYPPPMDSIMINVDLALIQSVVSVYIDQDISYSGLFAQLNCFGMLRSLTCTYRLGLNVTETLALSEKLPKALEASALFFEIVFRRM